jgi:hypothetical protein
MPCASRAGPLLPRCGEQREERNPACPYPVVSVVVDPAAVRPFPVVDRERARRTSPWLATIAREVNQR